MGFAAIRKFEVRNYIENAVREAFRNGPKLFEDADDFLALNVTFPKDIPAEFWLITNWEDEESFYYWHDNHRSELHQNIPKGSKLVKRGFSLNYFNRSIF
ncbi:antibiotic biosynthesis monooxygenase family protein [Fodinibius sp. SL11]|uniref:antibiotic biosynthesis monooxygenase family protein n=1 Tax=Fodinibius sp. SL11 TaxID=3425690 RepID=UPI003F883400